MNNIHPFADMADDLPFSVAAPARAFDAARDAHPIVARRIPSSRPAPRAAAPITQDSWAGFAQQHPAVAAWIVAKRDSFEFAGSLYEAVQRWGSLTERQLAAAEKCAARDAQPTAPTAQRAEAATAAAFAQAMQAVERARRVCQVCDGSGYMPFETGRLNEPRRACGYCGQTGKEPTR